MESCSCFYALGYGMFISVCIPFLMIFNYAPRFEPPESQALSFSPIKRCILYDAAGAGDFWVPNLGTETATETETETELS